MTQNTTLDFTNYEIKHLTIQQEEKELCELHFQPDLSLINFFGFDFKST
jgi:hypothetical protein